VSDWLTYLATVALVLGLLFLTLMIVNQIGRYRTRARDSRLTVTFVHSFGPKQQLFLVDLEGTKLLVGVTPTSINLITQIENQVVEEEKDS
jgi:flagellar biogenesis protein FliO